MNQLFGAQSPLMIAVRKILDVLLVNFLWIIVSIPVVTVGASTAAWYDVVYKDIRHSRGNAFFDFFHAFRANFRQAFPASAVFAAFSILLWLDIGLLHHLGTQGSPWGDLWALVLIVFAFAVIYFLWLSAYIARFRLGLREMALNTLKLLIAHLPAALLTGLVTGGCVGGLAVAGDPVFPAHSGYVDVQFPAGAGVPALHDRGRAADRGRTQPELAAVPEKGGAERAPVTG